MGIEVEKGKVVKAEDIFFRSIVNSAVIRPVCCPW